MKKKTEIILNHYIQNGNFFSPSESVLEANIIKLFEIYLTHEFDSVDELWKTLNILDSYKESDFYKFVMGHYHTLRLKDKSVDEYLNICLEGEISIFMRNGIGINRARKFVNIVKDSTSDGTLLEVGSGYMLPISSLEFARTLKTPIYSMDDFKQYYDNMDVFKKLGVTLISGKFDDTTDISNYCRIVGEAPCTAIRPIVEKCANRDDKEYFITMCECCSPRNGLTGFVEYLKSKDKNLRSFIVKQEYDYDGCHIIYGDKKLLLNKDEGLEEGMDYVYVTNSHKHNDDIMGVIAREWGL